MAQEEDLKLVQQFIDTYYKTSSHIENGSYAPAKDEYKQLLNIYEQMQKSKLDQIHQEIAYNQLMKIYDRLQKPPKVTNNYFKIIMSVFSALFIALLISGNTTLTGASVKENQAPIWDGPSEIYVQKEAVLDLDQHFKDPEEDELVYLATEAEGLKTITRNNLVGLYVYRPFNERTIKLMASDGDLVTKVSLKVIFKNNIQ